MLFDQHIDLGESRFVLGFQSGPVFIEAIGTQFNGHAEMGGARLHRLFAAFMRFEHHMGDFGAGFSERGIDRAAGLFGPSGVDRFTIAKPVQQDRSPWRRHGQGFMGAAVEGAVGHRLFQKAFDRAIHVAGQRQHLAAGQHPQHHRTLFRQRHFLKADFHVFFPVMVLGARPPVVGRP